MVEHRDGLCQRSSRAVVHTVAYQGVGGCRLRAHYQCVVVGLACHRRVVGHRAPRVAVSVRGIELHLIVLAHLDNRHLQVRVYYIYVDAVHALAAERTAGPDIVSCVVCRHCCQPVGVALQRIGALQRGIPVIHCLRILRCHVHYCLRAVAHYCVACHLKHWILIHVHHNACVNIAVYAVQNTIGVGVLLIVGAVSGADMHYRCCVEGVACGGLGRDVTGVASLGCYSPLVIGGSRCLVEDKYRVALAQAVARQAQRRHWRLDGTDGYSLLVPARGTYCRCAHLDAVVGAGLGIGVSGVAAVVGAHQGCRSRRIR